jgi:hypothetical protein
VGLSDLQASEQGIKMTYSLTAAAAAALEFIFIFSPPLLASTSAIDSRRRGKLFIVKKAFFFLSSSLGMAREGTEKIIMVVKLHFEFKREARSQWGNLFFSLSRFTIHLSGGWRRKSFHPLLQCLRRDWRRKKKFCLQNILLLPLSIT